MTYDEYAADLAAHLSNGEDIGDLHRGVYTYTAVDASDTLRYRGAFDGLVNLEFDAEAQKRRDEAFAKMCKNCDNKPVEETYIKHFNVSETLLNPEDVINFFEKYSNTEKSEVDLLAETRKFLGK